MNISELMTSDDDFQDAISYTPSPVKRMREKDKTSLNENYPMFEDDKQEDASVQSPPESLDYNSSVDSNQTQNSPDDNDNSDQEEYNPRLDNVKLATNYLLKKRKRNPSQQSSKRCRTSHHDHEHSDSQSRSIPFAQNDDKTVDYVFLEGLPEDLTVGQPTATGTEEAALEEPGQDADLEWLENELGLNTDENIVTEEPVVDQQNPMKVQDMEETPQEEQSFEKTDAVQEDKQERETLSRKEPSKTEERISLLMECEEIPVEKVIQIDCDDDGGRTQENLEPPEYYHVNSRTTIINKDLVMTCETIHEEEDSMFCYSEDLSIKQVKDMESRQLQYESYLKLLSDRQDPKKLQERIPSVE